MMVLMIVTSDKADDYDYDDDNDCDDDYDYDDVRAQCTQVLCRQHHFVGEAMNKGQS